ncbi:hypothetical protein X747_14815 [Mesorhizobium sp. LNJC384A00]|uniref:phage tail tip lysozyme n=1 Tax=Mesorhizobium sp. LNJC384A00 TaxID=1287268 RepID=UPI0003CDF5EC|nr:phage tail tip lysozyme [Mesorhizobium sp. LNJC384A00]ESY42047.1 hypothetical protein X747_14815 [Mesorhizobium sp. LNJC384A00]
MSLNLALVISGEASGAKAATAETTAGVKALGAEARQTASAMVAANDQVVASARGATEAITAQAAAQRQLQGAIQSMVAAAQPTSDAGYRQRAADIDAFGAALDRTRARYDPLFAAQMRHKAAVEAINQAERVGAISASLATDARLRETAALNSQVSALSSVAAAQKSAAQAMVNRVSIVPDRGSEIAAYGAELDQLRARFNPLYAASKQYETELDQLNAAHRVGAISGHEHEAALEVLNNRYTVLGQQGARAAGAFGAVGGAARLTSNQLLNLSRQGNDVVTMFALGAPPMMIFASQAGQIYDALESGPKGLRGSLAGIASGVKSAASSLISGAAAFVSFSNPVGLVATGIIAGTAALLTYASVSRESIRSIDDVLKDHEANIKDLKQAWAGDATAGIKTYASEGFGALAIKSVQTELELKASLSQAAQQAAKGMIANDNGLAGGSQFGVVNKSEFSQFGDEIDYLRGTIARGAPDVLGFRKMVEDRWKLDPTNQELERQALALHRLTDEAALAARALPAAQAAVNALVVRGGRPDFGQGAAMQADLIKNAETAYQLKRDQEVALGRIGARSPQELADAARAAERAKPITGESFAVRQLREESAAALAAAQAQHQLDEAQQQRARSLQQTIAGARVDLDLVGQTTAATEAYRLESQLLAQVQEEAARNHVAVDQAEIASIHQKAIEYGKLRALQEARDTIHGQVEDLEVQRAELALVGQSKLAHDRIIAALITEQEIRRLGIDVYGQEAEAMRANTAAAAELADATARASLQQQLQFDREQMFRSPTEQNVASTMRGAGLDYDPNSAIAQQIRYNEQLKTTKAAWEDIFSTVNEGIDGISDALFSGGSIEDAIKKAGQQLAKTVFDMAVTNPLKNWLTGGDFKTIADLGIFGNGATSGKGGGFGGVLGQMLGAQKAVASMQVQAASVFINGSPIGGIPGLPGVPGAANDNGGIVGWFKSLFSGSPAAANSNSQGGIAGPNTAATAAKLLSGLGSPLGFGNDTASTGSIASAASGGGVAGQVWNFFASKGLKPFQIAGILGNVKAESAFNPTAVGDGGNALGLFQWNDRAPSMLNAIGGRGNLGNVQSQLQFAWKELQSSEGMALKKLLGSTDVRGATSAFAGFERPKGFSWADPEGAHNFAGRLNGAQEALSRFGGTATSATSALSGSTSAISSLASSTGAAAKGLDIFGSGAGKLGSALTQFPAAPGGGGGGFGGLFNMFGGLFGGGGGIGSFSAGVQADFASGALGLGLFANGAAFSRGNVVPFARGDVFSSPTYFPMSAGRTGVLGEDGEEAVMPLQRGPDGRLGVVNHQPLRAPRAANGNAPGGGSSGGLARSHIEGIVNSIADKLKLEAKIINLNDGSDIKRWMMSEDGHNTVAVVNRRNGAGP